MNNKFIEELEAQLLECAKESELLQQGEETQKASERFFYYMGKMEVLRLVINRLK